QAVSHVHKCAHGVIREAAEVEPRGGWLARQLGQLLSERMTACQLLCAIRHEKQERQSCKRADEESQHVERGRVSPLEIVQKNDDGKAGRESREEVQHLREERQLAGDRTDRATLREDGRERGQGGRWGQMQEEVDKEAIRRGLREVVAAPNEHGDTLLVRLA